MSMYLLKKTATGYKFDVHSDDKVKVGTSEVYSTLAAAARGIATAALDGQTENILSPDAVGHKKVKFPRYEIYSDNEGKWRYRFKSFNGKTIFSSTTGMTKAEVGKVIPDYKHWTRKIIIVIVRGGVIIFVVVEIPNPILPVARPKAKDYLERVIRGEFALAKISKVREQVVTLEMPTFLEQNDFKPNGALDFNLSKAELPMTVKNALTGNLKTEVIKK